MTIENKAASELDENGFIKTAETVTGPEGVASAKEPEFEAPTKRKRGRPSNADRMAATGIPVGTGVPPKAKAAKAKVNYTSVDYAAMGKQLVGLHQVAAMATGIQEVVISDEEGFALAQAIGNVASQYDLAIDGKTGAALQLVMTAAMIYGPRVLMLKAKAAAARAQTVGENGQPA